ncbi:hypothetical protein TNCV_1875811 [Trichonephila clavipes]|nr:hypothetical protein TNCV_1875811 [Trichonephila clavipes]
MYPMCMIVGSRFQEIVLPQKVLQWWSDCRVLVRKKARGTPPATKLSAVEPPLESRYGEQFPENIFRGYPEYTDCKDERQFSTA